MNAKDMAKFLKSQAVGAAMVDAAQDGLKYAKSIAPYVSGDYQRSLYVEQVMVPVGKKNEVRASAMIASDIYYNGSVEAAHHVLSRTADYMRGQQ